jgi:hypothetical protein
MDYVIQMWTFIKTEELSSPTPSLLRRLILTTRGVGHCFSMPADKKSSWPF